MGEKAPDKKGRGRPRVRPENPVRARCDLSPGEATDVRKAAESVGEPVSTFARKAVVSRADRVLKKKPKRA